jgi:hypothetical protein
MLRHWYSEIALQPQEYSTPSIYGRIGGFGFGDPPLKQRPGRQAGIRGAFISGELLYPLVWAMIATRAPGKANPGQRKNRA